MSRRQLKKLQKSHELPHSEVEDADEINDRPTKPRPSLFASLAALEDEGDDDSDNQSNQDLPAPEELPVKSAEEPATSQSKKKKKKNKKKKKVTKEPDEPPSSEPQDMKGKSKSKGKGKAKNSHLDDIDRALKELDTKAKHGQTGTADASTTRSLRDDTEDRISELLKTNPYNLKVANEMRALFGKDIVAAAEAEEESTRRPPRQGAQRQMVGLEDVLKAPPGKGLKDVSINKNYFIQGKKTWPMGTAGGLSMKLIEDRSNAMEFAFSHDSFYDSLEKEFFARSHTLNPDLMIEFLRENPYHISSLIVVSKIAKHQGDTSLAAELCERALFSFGRIALASFKRKLEDGKARLSFKRLENRQFWLAAYQYVRSLSRKGTHKTALEWAKLLLMMDPADPYAIGQIIHVLAIKAKEFKWFLDLCDSGVLDTHWGYPAQTAGLARIRLGDEKGAVEAIRAGMQKLPWLYSRLFSTLGLDVAQAIWGSVVPDGPDELYTDLYIHQTKELWNFPRATELLFEAAHGFKEANTAQVAQHVALGVVRMVYLEENPDLLSNVPREMLHSEPNWEFDPLPPPRSENIFSSLVQEGYFDGAREDIGDFDPHEFLAANAGEPAGGTLGDALRLMSTRLSSLFRSAAPGTDEDEGVTQARGESHSRMMEALQDLLLAGELAGSDEDDSGWDGEFGHDYDSRSHGGTDSDEMPALIPTDAPLQTESVGQGVGRTENDDSDDEMPPLISGDSGADSS